MAWLGSANWLARRLSDPQIVVPALNLTIIQWINLNSPVGRSGRNVRKWPKPHLDRSDGTRVFLHEFVRGNQFQRFDLRLRHQYSVERSPSIGDSKVIAAAWAPEIAIQCIRPPTIFGVVGEGLFESPRDPTRFFGQLPILKLNWNTNPCTDLLSASVRGRDGDRYHRLSKAIRLYRAAGPRRLRHRTSTNRE